ncbi:hypothetical protein [Paraburkholderia sp. GAS32]|uniref:hypothetical protein n=1 Tax=Paraburkholderia sp. GAS32 TaxID=3035129 RepID=UPI003D25A732
MNQKASAQQQRGFDQSRDPPAKGNNAFGSLGGSVGGPKSAGFGSVGGESSVRDAKVEQMLRATPEIRQEGTARQKEGGAFGGLGVGSTSTAFGSVGGGSSVRDAKVEQMLRATPKIHQEGTARQKEGGAFAGLGVASRSHNPFSGVGAGSSRTLDKDGIRDASQSQMNRLRGIENAAREQTGHGKDGIARTPFEKGMKFGEKHTDKAIQVLFTGRDKAEVAQKPNAFSGLGVENDSRSVLAKVTQAARDAMEKHGSGNNGPREHAHEKQHQKRENSHAMGM